MTYITVIFGKVMDENVEVMKMTYSYLLKTTYTIANELEDFSSCLSLDNLMPQGNREEIE